MKKLLLLSLMVLMAVTVMARPVDHDRAVVVAKHFMAQYVKGADQYTAEVVYTHRMPKSGHAAMYVVNLGFSPKLGEGDPQGGGVCFVIVAADDVAHPVLGYSLSRPWPSSSPKLGEGDRPNGVVEESVLPPQVSGYLDDLAAQIESAAGSDSDTETVAEWRQLLTTNLSSLTTNLPDSVGPLLTTTWDQGQYYNALCPEDANGPAGHVYTGCVATAMAQIINYWGYPVHGRGIHSYETNYGTLEVDYNNANYDYAHMPNVLTAASTPQEVNAVATLMRDCGVAANMGYGPTESGSYDVDARAGLINFYRFSPNLSYAEKNQFSDAEWITLLQENITSQHPIMYSGHGTGGHSFVCDGYKTNDYFHFNFGWSGYADGWYLTNALNPSGYDFSSSQSILIGIVPDSSGNIILGQMAGNSTFILDGPMEFYHLLGHNLYHGIDYSNSFSSNTTFIAADTTVPIVTNLVNYEGDQSVRVYYGNDNDYHMVSPTMIWFPLLESFDGTFTLEYTGYWRYAGFCLSISPQNTCVSIPFFNVTTTVDSNQINLSWTDNANEEWDIEYGFEGFAHGNGEIVTLDTSYVTINNLLPYTYYDVYIKPSCTNIWTTYIRIKTDLSYWQDYVSEEPEGIVYNNDGYALVSTPEQLAWLVRNNSTCEKVLLTSDLDMSGHRWNPEQLDYYNGKEINGNGHSISNLLIRESKSSLANYIGFIGDYSPRMWPFVIRDLTFVNPIIKAERSITRCGVIAGEIRSGDCTHTIINCGVSGGEIDCITFSAGGLVGAFEGDMLNCYSNISVKNSHANPHTGGLVGDMYGGHIINCYTASEIVYTPFVCSKGQIAGAIERGVIKNVYGKESEYELLAQVQFGEVYDVISFGNNYVLNAGIPFDDSTYFGLCDALNMKVHEYNDSTLRLWRNDSVLGYPVLGELYHGTCNNANGITATNVIHDGDYSLRLEWAKSSALSYVVKCINLSDTTDTVRLFNVNSNPCFIANLQLGDKYEIYVKCNCDSSSSGWGTPITIIFDKPYWTDVVTTQPNGYIEDANGNVTISSAEGLSWFSSCVNGLNGNDVDNFRNKKVLLTSDIDLGQYRWLPIGYNQSQFANIDKYIVFQGEFDGNGHIISNMYINEDVDFVGFFGMLFQAKVINVTIKDSYIKGRIHVGGLCGLYYNSNTWWDEFNYGTVSFDNCHINNTTVYGINRVGGMLGLYQPNIDSSIIRNCSSSGTVEGGSEYGGLIGFVAQQSNKHVDNCFSISKVTYNNGNGQDNGYYGGLIGYAYNTRINNCFFAGSLDSLAGCWSGLIIGVLDNSHANCLYGLSNNIYGPFSVYGVNTVQNTTLFTELEEQQILQNPVTINDATYNNLLSALNAWVDAYDTAGIYRHWAADSTGENDGFPVFAYIPCTPVAGSDSIIVCDSYAWHGKVYTTSTELIDSLTTLDGCDSIVTHHLIVNHGSTHTDTVSADESYTWGDSIYTATGIYQRTYTDANSCDSMVALWLTITKTVHDTTYVDIHDTTYIDVHDTTYLQVHDTTYITVHDTTYMTVHDTTYITVHDTTYIDVPYPVHDTMVVHDTTYIDVPYAVHDTTYIDVHDTTYVFVHDTTYIQVHDTTYIDVPYPVHDTTYINVYVHDTTYVDVHDTAYVPYPVHDTTYVDVHDTTYVPYPVHDTTYVDVHDTTYVPYPVHDTTYVDVHDTTYVPYLVHDTTYVDVHDTTYVPYPVHDTTYVPYPVHDTLVITDTLWMIDTIFVYDTIVIHDTITVGVDAVEYINAKIYANHGQIVVEGADGNTVTLYDVSGRMLATKRDDYLPLRLDVPASGTYMVKIGDYPARRVVVIK